MSSTSSISRTIVVLGATGQQGGAVARALATSGEWRVRVLSRTTDSDPARRLAAEGFDAVRADMEEPASLTRGSAGAHGVLSVLGAEQGRCVEARRGIAVADAALAASVSHFVYASVGGAYRR